MMKTDKMKKAIAKTYGRKKLCAISCQIEKKQMT